MKKRLLIALLVAACTLTACSKEEVVIKVENDIASIGEVTADDAGRIAEISEEYNALSKRQKSAVENATVLASAMDKVAKLQAEAQKQEEDTSRQEEESAARIEECLTGGLSLLEGVPADEEIQQAFELFEEAWSLGSMDANFFAGYVLNCYPSMRDYAGALNYFELATDYSPYANIGLAILYQDGNGVAIDEEKSAAYATKAMEMIEQMGITPETTDCGPYARFLSTFYNYSGSSKGIKTSYEYAKKGAELGEVSCMITYGIMNMYGTGTSVDVDEGMLWLDKAIELGSSDAMVQKGNVYLTIAQKDSDYYEEALYWFDRAAGLSNTSAMNNIAYMYKNGLGIEKDYEEAMSIYEISASLGDSDAMYYIGHMYDFGEGVDQDYTQAAMWYEKAAELGHADAAFNVGWLYEYSEQEDFPIDYGKAMEWFLKSAELGNSAAMCSIGEMYQFALGVDEDLDTAIEWYKKSALLGNAAAQEYLAEIEGVS